MTTQSIEQLFDLTGKSAIVTGGSMGIGQSIAFRLAEAGAQVTITARRIEFANQTVDQIRERGGIAQAVSADASQAADAEKTVKAAIEAFGRIDILVNNAGTFPHSTIMDMSEEMWDKVFEVNLKSVLLNSQACGREMIKAGTGGKIVNISSRTGVHPKMGMSQYSSSKAAVNMLTKCLALELAPNNILVNAVVVGGVITPGILEQAASAPKEKKPANIESIDNYVSRIALSRIGEADDVAKVVLFLASSASDYMTGSLILLDGGYELT